MELARTVPELQAALRERNQLTVDQIAHLVALGTGRHPSDLDVQLFVGVLLGAWLAALHRPCDRDSLRNTAARDR